MVDSNETRTISGWRTASKLYRKPPGVGWLLALLAVPLLLGLLGWAALDKSKEDVDVALPSVNPSATLTMPSVSAPNVNVPNLSLAPLSIIHSGNDYTLSGDLPDATAKASLLDALKGALGPGVNLVDNVNLKTGVTAPDFSGLGALFKAAVDIPDFSFKLVGDTLTLTGTAPSEEVKSAVAAAATAAWPNVKISNEIQVIAPTGAATPAPVTPAPAPVSACTTLQADISGLLQTPINFETNGFTLTPASQQMLTQIAEKLKGCPDSNATVNGYTDSSGNDAINIPLSGNRAKSVADYLVSQGVAQDHVTSKGFGSADPIAPNDTAAGMAQNRRVVIVVS